MSIRNVYEKCTTYLKPSEFHTFYASDLLQSDDDGGARLLSITNTGGYRGYYRLRLLRHSRVRSPSLQADH